MNVTARRTLAQLERREAKLEAELKETRRRARQLRRAINPPSPGPAIPWQRIWQRIKELRGAGLGLKEARDMAMEELSKAI